MQDRRQNVRVPWVTGVVCEDPETGDRYPDGQISDISLSGVCLYGVPVRPGGTRLRLRFTLPSLQMDVDAAVVHTTASGAMGLTFVDLTAVQRVVIQELMRFGPAGAEAEGAAPDPQLELWKRSAGEQRTVRMMPGEAGAWALPLPPLAEKPLQEEKPGQEASDPVEDRREEEGSPLERLVDPVPEPEPDPTAEEEEDWLPPLPPLPGLPPLEPAAGTSPPPPAPEPEPEPASEPESPVRGEAPGSEGPPAETGPAPRAETAPPVVTAPPAAPAEPAVAPSNPGVGDEAVDPDSRPRVLIVDDHDRTRLMLRSMIEGREKAFEVTEASDGQQCLEVVDSQGPFDLIFLDVDMPRLDGLGACRELRARGVRSFIIFLTGRSEMGDFRAGREAGADTYIKKPIVLGTLRSMLSLFTSGSLQRR